MIRNKATLEINCDDHEVTVWSGEDDPQHGANKQAETSRAALVAMILAIRSRDLMRMTRAELMSKHIEMLSEEPGAISGEEALTKRSTG